MKDILILVATGFEDVELVATLDVFAREGISFDVVSVEDFTSVKGQNVAIVETQKLSDISNIMEYKGLFLPGGKGHTILLENDTVIETVKEYKKAGKLLTAICAAPSVFEKADVLAELKYTAFPGFAEGENKVDQPFVENDKLITGRDFEATIEFAKAIATKIKND